MKHPSHSRHLKNPLKKSSLRIGLGLLISGFFLLAAATIAAAPLPADLKIFTSLSTDPNAGDYLSFDEANSSPATGNATHTGSLVQTIGGASTTTTINDTTITSGSNPLSGTLTDIGDGWEIHSNIIGSFTDITGAATNTANIYDLFFSLQNLSATDSITVTISLDFDNHVNASGSDAFAASEIQLFDGSGAELFFSDLLSDTIFGNQSNGIDTGTFGGPLNDSELHQLVLILSPGDLLDFHILHFIAGGAFGADSSYSASLGAVVSFDAAIHTNPPNPIPEPGIFALIGIGLLGILFGRRITA